MLRSAVASGLHFFPKINLHILVKAQETESWKLLQIWYSSDDFLLYVLLQLVNWTYIYSAEYNPDQYLWEPEFTLAGRKYKRIDLEASKGSNYPGLFSVFYLPMKRLCADCQHFCILDLFLYIYVAAFQ